jgi:predicted permease
MIAIARWLLRRLLPADVRQDVLADLDTELAQAIVPTRTRSQAARWYWRHVIGSIGPALRMRLRRVGRLASDAARDGRIGVRLLARQKTFTATAVLTLSLGIGAVTAIFSVVDAVLLRPLPYGDPLRLVRVWSANPRGLPHNDTSAPNYFDWAERARGFDALAGVAPTAPTLTGAGDPVELAGAVVTANLAATLRVAPRLGRWFAPADTAGPAQSVVILGEALWRERFEADAGILGRAITLDTRPYVVIGIMPAQFSVLTADERLWMPLPDDWRTKQPRDAPFLSAIGRLAAGVTIEAARDSLRDVARALETEYPQTNRGWGVTIEPLHASMTGAARTPLLVLFGAVAAILLIACANVASLLLARGSARSRELAIRAAIGATASRLVRQQLAEAALLAVTGGAAAVLVAAWSVQFMRTILPAAMPLAGRVALDMRVMAVAATATLASAALTGLLPAWYASRNRAAALLRDGGRTTSSVRARQALVFVQIAAATALVAGGLVLVRSLARLTAVPSGFQPDRTLLADVSLPASRYGRDARAPFFDRALDQIRALPGVQAAGAGGPLPLSGRAGLLRFGVEAEQPSPSADGDRAYVRWTTPGYFAAMGIPRMKGRDLTAADAVNAEPVCVIDTVLARRLFGTQDAVGRRVRVSMQRNVLRTVVGVVGPVRQTSLDRDADPHLYMPEAQFPSSALTLVVRSSQDASALAASVRGVIASIDRDLPVSNVRSLADLVAGSTANQRYSTALLSALAAIALLLTVVGVYGVVSQTVAQCTREMAVRVALGASHRDIVSATLRRASLLSIAGVLAGCVVAWVGTPALRGMLYGVGPHDPIALAGAAALLVGTALGAAYLPARRLLRIDVVHSLRNV